MIQTEASPFFFSDKEFSHKQDTGVPTLFLYFLHSRSQSWFEVGDDENQMVRSVCSAPEFSEVFCFLLGKGNTLFWGLVLNILDVALSVIKTANWNKFQLQ